MEQKRDSFSNMLRIDLREVYWRIIEQWRAILVFSVCIMLVFIGFMKLNAIIENKSEGNGQDQVSIQSEQEIIDSLSESEQSLVSSAYRLWLEREQLGEYIDNALIMEIDSNHAKRVRVSWSIDSYTINDISILELSYITSLQSNECRLALLQASGVNVSVEQQNDLLYITYPDESVQGGICCDFFITENMNAEEVQSEFKRQIDTTYKRLQDDVGDHQIKNYRSEIAIVSDERVLKKQTEALSYYANLNSNVNNLRNTFSSEQKDAFSKLIEKKPTIQTEKKVETPPVLSQKNIIIGLAFGVFIYVCLFLLYVILSNRILSSKPIQESQIRLLGELYTSNSKYNPLLRDKLIWDRRHRKMFDEAKETDKVLVTLKSICQYKQLDSVLLVLTADSLKQQTIIDEITSKLVSNGISVEIALTEKQNIDKAIISVGGVVLIIIENKTRANEIDSILERCIEYDKPVLGSVYLG